MATSVSAGDSFEEDRFDTGGIPSTAVGAGITAIRILANGSSDHGAPISAMPAGPARPPAPLFRRDHGEVVVGTTTSP